MKRKLLTAALLLAATLTFSDCGEDADQQASTSTTDMEQTSEEATAETKDIFTKGTHDATEKENSYESAIDAARKVSKGKADTIDGKYDVNGITYTFDGKNATIVMDGKYEFTDKGIKLGYSGTEEKTYEITETDEGFNLMAEGTLLPLVYMSGDDGLTGSDLFSGVYSMGLQGYVFTKDGSLAVVNVYDDLKVKDDSVTFAGQTYDYRSKDGKIILSTNGTDVMTLVP